MFTPFKCMYMVIDIDQSNPRQHWPWMIFNSKGMLSPFQHTMHIFNKN